MVRDPFSYSARWDSAGIGCYTCRHQSEPSWPDLARSYRCTLHRVRLRIELTKEGRVDGEWFCKEFADDGRMAPSRAGLAELESIRGSLEPNTLYRCKQSDFLEQVPFSELERAP